MGALSGSCRDWQQCTLHDDGGAGSGVGAAMMEMAKMEAMRIRNCIVRFRLLFLEGLVVDRIIIWM